MNRSTLFFGGASVLGSSEGLLDLEILLMIILGKMGNGGGLA